MHARTRLSFAVAAALLGPAALMLVLPPRPSAAQTAPLFQQLQLAETIEERIEVCDRIDPGKESPYGALFCDGYALLAAERDSLAGEYLEAALRTRPDLAVGCVLFADAYMERGKLDLAEKWYTRARAIDPDRLDPHYGLGRIWLERAETQGDPAFEKALDALRAMTRIEPSNPDGWANVGMVQARLGRYDEAETSYERALRLAPEDPVLHDSIGSLAVLRGDDDAAEESWRRALEIDPSHAPAIRELAALHGRRGRIEEAVETLQDGAKAAHLGPTAGRVRRDLALLHLLAGDLEEAGALLEEARVLSPDARTLAALAHTRLLQGSLAAGAEHLARAAREDSTVAAPVVRAWREPILANLDRMERQSPETARSIGPLARSAREDGPAGAETTSALVERLLPDWDLPERGFTVPEETSELPYDTPPVPVYRALASYPDAAGGIDGTIHVQVRIDAVGRVVEAEVVGEGGNPALEYAALDAARNWRFEPARRKGEPVASEVTIPFRFTGR